MNNEAEKNQPKPVYANKLGFDMCRVKNKKRQEKFQASFRVLMNILNLPQFFRQLTMRNKCGSTECENNNNLELHFAVCTTCLFFFSRTHEVNKWRVNRVSSGAKIENCTFRRKRDFISEDYFLIENCAFDLWYSLFALKIEFWVKYSRFDAKKKKSQKRIN